MIIRKINRTLRRMFRTDTQLIDVYEPQIQHEIDAEKKIRELTIERKSEQEINRQRSQ